MSLYTDLKKKKGCIKGLAPMEDVTDTVFRRILCSIGRPDIFFTEFMNVEGYCSEGKEEVVHRLEFSSIERPIVFQLWGLKPENFAKTVLEVRDFKPDGIDINMGCSVRDVLHIGAGSALIKDKGLALEIIDAVKSNAKGIPVSVKTRVGYSSLELDEWIGFLLKQDLDLLTIHGRLAKEGYSTPSRWDIFKDIVNLRNSISPTTLILGNGDISSLNMGMDLVKQYSLDGFMVGRGVLSNPWFFSNRKDISKEERLKTLYEHLCLYRDRWGIDYGWFSQKKFVKAYINGFDGASDLRMKFMVCDSLKEVMDLTKSLQ